MHQHLEHTLAEMQQMEEAFQQQLAQLNKQCTDSRVVNATLELKVRRLETLIESSEALARQQEKEVMQMLATGQI